MASGNIFPANLLIGATAFALAGEAHTSQTLVCGENNAAIAIIPSVAFVLLHHRELYAIDGDQLIKP